MSEIHCFLHYTKYPDDKMPYRFTYRDLKDTLFLLHYRKSVADANWPVPGYFLTLLYVFPIKNKNVPGEHAFRDNGNNDNFIKHYGNWQ